MQGAYGLVINVVKAKFEFAGAAQPYDAAAGQMIGWVPS